MPDFVAFQETKSSIIPTERGILKILITSTLLNIDLIKGSSQDLVMGSMSSDTFVRIVLPRGVIIFLEQTFGIQQSDHILMFEPSPTLQILPRFRVCSPAQILCHEYEEPFFNCALRISPVG
jgi:hypothetical protein